MRDSRLRTRWTWMLPITSSSPAYGPDTAPEAMNQLMTTANFTQPSFSETRPTSNARFPQPRYAAAWPDGLETQVGSMASGGYFLTAMGRDGTGIDGSGGYILVGTKPQGSAPGGPLLFGQTTSTR